MFRKLKGDLVDTKPKENTQRLRKKKEKRQSRAEAL